jgi:hypothetical protein
MSSPRRSSMVPRIRAYDFHDGGLDGFLVLKHGDGVEARLGDGDGAKHALVEIAELLSAESGPGWPIPAALFAARVGTLTVILKERVLRALHFPALRSTKDASGRGSRGECRRTLFLLRRGDDATDSPRLSPFPQHRRLR